MILKSINGKWPHIHHNRRFLGTVVFYEREEWEEWKNRRCTTWMRDSTIFGEPHVFPCVSVFTGLRSFHIPLHELFQADQLRLYHVVLGSLLFWVGSTDDCDALNLVLEYCSDVYPDLIDPPPYPIVGVVVLDDEGGVSMTAQDSLVFFLKCQDKLVGTTFDDELACFLKPVASALDNNGHGVLAVSDVDDESPSDVPGGHVLQTWGTNRGKS